MADEEEQGPEQQVVQLQFAPVPFNWEIGKVALPNGTQLVTLKLQTQNGIEMFFFEGPAAQACGEAMTKEGAAASIAVVGPQVLEQIVKSNGHLER